MATKGSAALLLHTLKVIPFCDGGEVGDLTTEQQAALHVFQYEVLASYHRLLEKVPADVVNSIIDARLGRAFGRRSAAA